MLGFLLFYWEWLSFKSYPKRVSSPIPSLFLPLSRHRTFLCSLRRTGSSLVETIPTHSTVTGTLTRNVTDVTRRKKMKSIGKKLHYGHILPPKNPLGRILSRKQVFLWKQKVSDQTSTKISLGFLWPERVAWEWGISTHRMGSNGVLSNLTSYRV